MRFLENPERDWQRDDKNLGMLTLFRGALTFENNRKLKKHV
jgi:hypothetical protein